MRVILPVSGSGRLAGLLLAGVLLSSCERAPAGEARGEEARPTLPAGPDAPGGSAAVPSSSGSTVDRPGHAGSDACAPCHRELYDSWKESTHFHNMFCVSRPAAGILGKIAYSGCRPEAAIRGNLFPVSAAPGGANIRPPAAGRMLGDFERNNEHSFAGTHSRMFTREGGYFMEYTSPRGRTGTYAIDYALGIHRHQVYLHRQEDGRLQVLPTHWNPVLGRWEDSREGPLTEGPTPLPEGHPAYWEGYTRTFDLACMECHSSQPDKHFDAANARYASTFDPAINCEACHGPAAEHVAARREGRVEPRRLASPEPPDSVYVCASCHARKRIVREGYVPGENFWDYFMPQVWDSEQFYRDGRSSGTTYNWVEFMQSACQLRSSEPLDCAGRCHPPHAARSRAVQTVEQSNAACTGCHVNYTAGQLTGHTFHGPDSEGSRCVSCHMPRLEVAEMPLADHTISSPLPELTRRFGVPNACTLCHRHDSPDWAEQHVRSWYGDRPTFQAYRARLVERTEVLARIFDKNGRFPTEELIRWLDAPRENVVQRASAAQFLGQGPPGAEARAALLRHRGDRHPLVRYHVIEALGRFPGSSRELREALGDPRRTVRIVAYEELRRQEPAVEQETTAEVARARAELQHRDEVVWPDDPRTLSREAFRRFQRGDNAEAERLLQRCIALTGRMPLYRVSLMQLLVALHRLDEAEAVVQELEQLDPESEEAGLARAQLLLARFRPAEARTVLDRLVAAGQRSETLVRLQGMVERQLALPYPPAGQPPR